MKTAFRGDAKEKSSRYFCSFFLFSGEGRGTKEGSFILFNTLKRSDDLLLFKTGMHFSPCLCCKRQKRKQKCLSVERHNCEDSKFYRLSSANLRFLFGC